MRNYKVQRCEIDQAFQLYDTLSHDSGLKDEAASMVRKLTNRYLNQFKLNRDNDILPDGKFTEEELKELSSGRIIAAIKLVRQRTAMSLKDAKNYVDEYNPHRVT